MSRSLANWKLSIFVYCCCTAVSFNLQALYAYLSKRRLRHSPQVLQHKLLGISLDTQSQSRWRPNGKQANSNWFQLHEDTLQHTRTYSHTHIYTHCTHTDNGRDRCRVELLREFSISIENRIFQVAGNDIAPQVAATPTRIPFDIPSEQQQPKRSLQHFWGNHAGRLRGGAGR